MRKKFKILLFAFFLPFVGCQNFLDEEPSNMLPMEGAIESVSDCESFLTGVYAALKNASGIAGSGTLAPDLQTDLMNQVLGNQLKMSAFHNWDFTSQDDGISGIWGAYYGVIFRVNFLLEGIEKVKTQITEKLQVAATDKDKEVLEEALAKLQDFQAQGCMARAFCRVELVKLFADAYDPAKASTQLALPLWNTPKIGTPERTTMDKYYKAVFDDLKVAETIRDGSPDNIYFTKGAARALETRVHVYMHNWKDAIISATDVIENYNYELLNAVDTAREPKLLSTPYGKMWSEDSGNEIIWKIGYTAKDESLGSLGGIFYGLDGSGKFYPEYMPSKMLARIYPDGDARMGIFFEERATNYAHEVNILAFRKYPGNKNLNYVAGVDRYINMPKVFRLSEIYLLRAEAYYHEGEVVLANNDLSELKQRRIAFYVGTSLTGDELYQEIKNERIRELCMEGHRLYDLKRYAEGFNREEIEGGVPAAFQIKVTPDDVRFTWPIPKHEMDVPHSQMVGNPSNRL